jgi:translation initiation factor IF-1
MNPVYIFWDQGGLFGKSRCVLSKKNLKVENEDDHDIFNYYLGYMESHYIKQLIQCFDNVNKCTTEITEQ